MSLNLKSNVHQINLNGAKSSDSNVYGFENYRLDVEHLMLYRDGEEVSLTPKQVETLLALTEQPGEIVSKDALMNRLWGDAAVEESNLVQNIYILRKTLGNSTDGRPMIETLRRRGYRFNAELTNHKHRLPEVSAALRIADLSALDESGPYSEVQTDEHQKVTFDWPTSVHTLKRGALRMISGTLNYRAVTIVVALFLVAAFGYGLTSYLLSPKAETLNGERTIAVLPLRPVNPASRNELYEFGIADSLINRLSLIEGLHVRPLGAVIGYTDLNQDPISAGRQLKVNYVLALSYQLAEGKIRVATQLLNISTGRMEDTFDLVRDASGVFAVQDAVASDLAGKLMTRFGGRLSGSPAKRGTDSEEAYRLYQLGMALLSRGGPDPAQRALSYLNQAVALDPGYARAWAAMAGASRRGFGGDDQTSEEYQKSIYAVNKALTLDPNLSDAYTSLCTIKLFYEFDADGAEAACKRAIELDPNSADAHLKSNMVFLSRGRLDEALAEIKAALDIEPNSFHSQRQLANTLASAGRYPEAEEQFKRLIDLNPENASAYRRLIRVLEAEGKEAEALNYLIRSTPFEIRTNTSIDPDAVEKYAAETIERFKKAYATSGWRGVVMERIKLAEADPRPGHVRIAEWYAYLGDKDKAFEHLEKAFQARSVLLMFLRAEPYHLDSLRDDPRFEELIRRIDGR